MTDTRSTDHWVGAEHREAMADAERFRWWFSPAPKAHYLLEYQQGLHEKWSLDEWRISIDRAMRASK